MVIRFLIEKEFKQMMRNIILPIVFVLLPLGMINIMPRAATQEVKDLKICVIDNDHSTSRSPTCRLPTGRDCRLWSVRRWISS